MLYIRLRIFIRSAYVSCCNNNVRTIQFKRAHSVLTMVLSRLTSSSCATTLLRRPLRLLGSVLSSPLLTLSMTSLNKATLRPYAITAPYGSSLVESSFTASRASSSALVRARREDGRDLVGSRGSGGDNKSLSGTISWCCVKAREEEACNIDLGGGSDNASGEEEPLGPGCGEPLAEEAWRASEKAATAAKFAEPPGREKGVELNPEPLC